VVDIISTYHKIVNLGKLLAFGRFRQADTIVQQQPDEEEKPMEQIPPCRHSMFTKAM
jgi:hypothetical protein